ncbi:MAG: hypothetical protein JWN52_2304, partial [Actinomycetia bacterium]|nr:hypothetical protein [Actinomycetes bacterium]
MNASSRASAGLRSARSREGAAVPGLRSVGVRNELLSDE